MPERGEGIAIRSFRVCFRLERRLHKIDRWRIPLPYGMPVRGIVYGALVLAGVLVAERVPVLSSLLGVLHPILRYGLVPVAAGYLLTELSLDGRSGHAVVRSWLRMRLQPRRISAFRAAPAPGQVRLGSVTVAPDERGPRLRPGVIEGRGPIVVRCPVRMRTRGRTLRVRQQSDGVARPGKRINLRRGQRVAVG